MKNKEKAPLAGASLPRDRMLIKLKESGLTAADAKMLNLQPCTAEESAALGLPRAGDGFKIPYYGMDGELLSMFRYRYFDTVVTTGMTKGAKLDKYAQPANTPVEVYLPRVGDVNWQVTAKDAGASLCVTEGELKSACATKLGFPTLGLGGVFSFGSKMKLQKLVPVFHEFKWKSRNVFICYDSDAVKNVQVVIAESRLAIALTELGACVFVVRLPQPGKLKVGLDDFIMKEGPDVLEQLLEDTKPFSMSAALHQLNSEVLYVQHPSMIAEYPKVNQPGDQPRYRMMRVGAFKDEVYAQYKYTVQIGEKLVEKPAAKDWIAWEARAQVDSVVYAPGWPQLVDDKQLNLWEGWGATPVKGSVALFEELIDYIFRDAAPEHKKWFLNWVAYPLQHPGVKMNSAVVMWSTTQGAGKSLLGYTIGRLYGKNFIEVNKPQLSSAFNDWAANKQFIMGDEVTGGSGREIADVLKNMITGLDVTVNKKFEPCYTIKNCANFFFTSNHQDAFFLTAEDRRYFIHEINGHKPSDAFFKTYDKWYRSQDGANALFYHLLNDVTVNGFNPMAEAPRTEGRKDMVAASKSDHAAWLAELREFPDNKLRVGDTILPFALYTTEDLMNLYQPDDGSIKRRYPITAKAMRVALKEEGFKLAADGVPVDTLKGKKQRLWCIRDREKMELLTAKQASELYASERAGGAKQKFKR